MATHQKKHNKRKTNEFILKIENENQEYAEIIAAKGCSRFEVKLIKNNEKFNVKLRGLLTHGPYKQRIEKNNIVLLHPDNSTTDNDKYYIIHKYSSEDIKKLQKMGELKQIKITSIDNNEEDDSIIFDTDIITKKLEEVEINEDFINNI